MLRHLDQMDLERLPPLGMLPALKALHLSGNRISSVEEVSLTGMPNLIELDLSKNRLVTLSPNPFVNVTLIRLNLSKNKIRGLEARSFRTLSSLAELKLSRNMLTPATFNRSGSTRIFANLTKLRSLDLNGNQLHQLQGLMFEDLKKLKILKLRRNEITTFSDGVFYGLDSIDKLFLDYNNITTVEAGLLFGLKSLEYLSLSYNQIDSIRPNAWQSTKELISLDLSHNRLVSLREGTFRGLGSLTTLTLSHNHLAHIEQDSFESTSNLLSLDLSQNQLRWSVEDNSGAFSRLDNLKSLSLAYNGIETVHVETFVPLMSLASLDLRGNQLRTLPNNPFARLKHLTSVHLNTSSLVCDCHLSWLPGWLSAVTFNASSSMIISCNYPTSLRDRPVSSLLSTDFSCESSPRPIISQSPKDQIVLHGANVTLACVAQAGAEGDQPKFMWRKNNQLLVDLQPETHISVIGGDGEGGARHNVTSLLHLRNVSDEDSGEYQCVVRNHFGASYSQRANIRVHVFPYFTKTPTSVAVRMGEVAKLECDARGSPTPEISLLKDGGEDFPAARERRIHVFSNETIFFIKPVQPHDEGQYTCKASNAAGTASAHASVTGTGLPSPKVTWSKNGIPLEDDGHYVLVEDSRYLLIKEAQMDDVGIYVCELTNILGTARGHVNLSIRDMTNTSTTTGIVVMAVVVCVVVTSLIWVVIIHQTRKRAQTTALGPPAGYPREDGLSPYPPHLPTHHHLPPDLVHTFTPLLANPPEPYTTAGQDSGSEHSSGKDSGTGDSAQRSSEDLLPLDLTRPGLRRSLIICADSGSPSVIRGISAVNVGPSGEIIGCEEALGRPRLSTFSPQHLSPGGYSPNHYTASLRRGSNSRLLPVSSPVTPSATLPRGQYLCQANSYLPQPTVASPSTEISTRHIPQVVQAAVNNLGSSPSKDQGSHFPELAARESLVVNSENEVFNTRTSVCSVGDGRSELDIRTEDPDAKVNNSIPPKQTLESR
ncbi:Leucine-rich repeats and immunoglobulin-like domains protein 3-like 1 [Homarus americanus]|uniref:Leucine-rich repeats and immunoglobulin-like domains protein 3-like 1 n=1 Tax=Homarus americanus TaxID=6706 RepID=A0A8J5MLJ6_HOMAM|nr:Leucine-rich repeats and immunoglobulin-like domains protein 3-like 1 [Homarus americanus]